MRTLIFRALAGLLAILFAWVLITGDHSAWSLRMLAGLWSIEVLFASFAVFGIEPAERFLCLVTGNSYPTTRSGRDDASDEKPA